MSDYVDPLETDFPPPEIFWSERLTALEAAEAQQKYSLVCRLPALEEATRTPALRTASQRWPGALREAELSHPDEVLRRAASAAMLREGQRRESVCEVREAVVLWGVLHAMLLDQRALRGERSELNGCTLDRLVARDEARVRATGAPRRWPSPPCLRRVAGAKVRPRQAYLWLAARVGWRLPALNFRLFGRAGHWDTHPDDPPWSREPTLSR